MKRRRIPRPSLKSPCVADRYHHGAQRIAEFSWTQGGRLVGGLIELSALPDGKLLVSVYRCDPGVVVRAGPALVEWRANDRPGGEPIAALIRGDYPIGRRPLKLGAPND